MTSSLSIRFLSILAFFAILLSALPTSAAQASATYSPAAQQNISQPAIATGGTHTCFLKGNGSIVCWGDSTEVLNNIPTSAAGFAQISSGDAHVCVLNTDWTIRCWGNDSYTQLDNVPTSTTAFTQISAGGFHTCALNSDTTLACWGSNANNQLDIPSTNSNFTQVSSGLYHTCAIKNDKSAVCWGYNVNGQTTPPADNTNFVQISAGGAHTCGLKNNGTIVCWGNSAQVTVPAPNLNFVQISAGWLHTCGLKIDGSVVCWGDNTDKQILPPTPNTNFVQINAKENHTCALTNDDAVVCWGDNNDHQAPSIVLSPASLSAVDYGAAFSQDFTAAGGSLASPTYTYDLYAGALPDGLGLTLAGHLSGTTAQAGAFNFTVRARDDNNYMGAQAYSLTVNKADTTTALQCPQSPSIYGQNVTFTATVAPVQQGLPGAPTGSVTFSIDGNARQPGVALNSGSAALSLTTIGVGPHTITASYGGDTNFNTSVPSSGCSLTVNPAPLAVAADEQTKVYGTDNPTLTYQITGFVNNEQQADVVSGTLELTTTAAKASGVGDYPITIQNCDPISCTLSAANYTFQAVDNTLHVTPATLTVTADDQTRAYGAPTPGLTYQVTGYVNNDDPQTTVLGAANVSTLAEDASPVGAYDISVAKGTLSAANYQFAFAKGTLVIHKAGTTTTLTTSANSIPVGQRVIFTITVAPATSGAPTGVVTITIGSQSPQTVALVNGQASLVAHNLPVGTYSVSVSYAGDGNFTASDSNASPLSQVIENARIFIPLVSR